jgi:hypothetical protein
LLTGAHFTVTDEEHMATLQQLDALRTTRREGTSSEVADAASALLTTSASIGASTEPLLPFHLSPTRALGLAASRPSCEETRYASDYVAVSGKSPFANLKTDAR